MWRLEKIFKSLILSMPAALYFSYFPVISLGENSTMNFELSVAILWLVVFDMVGVILVILKIREVGLREVLGFKKGSGWRKWLWILFLVYVLISVLWSLNTTRGILTAGMLIFIYVAAALLVTVLPAIVSSEAEEFRRKFLKWFFGASVVACLWCFIQCFLDLGGASQNVTLMCDGCVTAMFGFPHPNGLAIEPQFMGNLLLAPTIVSFYLMLKKFDKKLLILNLVFSTTVFLTFSRGAIYALAISMVFFVVMEIVRTKKWRATAAFGVLALAFLFTLNLQGIMAELSPTNDTYLTGVSKVLNHLSLGTIKISVNESGYAEAVGDATEVVAVNETGNDVVGNAAGNAAAENEAVFDGYVAESTETRMRLTDSALAVWRSDFKTAAFGVGIGGAGQALYNYGFSSAPKEIVQNEYASILLETGAIGFLLFILTVILIIRAFIKSPARGVLLTLVVAYGITLFFFSGLPNALQVYLMPAAIYGVYGGYAGYVGYVGTMKAMKTTKASKKIRKA